MSEQRDATLRLLSRNWRTIEFIARRLGITPQGASARIRDLRKKRYGSHTIARRLKTIKPMVYEYKRMDRT